MTKVIDDTVLGPDPDTFMTTDDPVTMAERRLGGMCPKCGAGPDWKRTYHHLKNIHSHDPPVNQTECERCHYIYSTEAINGR